MAKVLLRPRQTCCRDCSSPGWLLCWHGVSKGIHIHVCTEDARPLRPPREEQKAP